MADFIHISVARQILNSGEPVDITCWKKEDGSILELKNVLPLRYDYRGGWRNVKLLASGQIRRVRDVCIFKVNDMVVYL